MCDASPGQVSCTRRSSFIFILSSSARRFNYVLNSSVRWNCVNGEKIVKKKTEEREQTHTRGWVEGGAVMLLLLLLLWRRFSSSSVSMVHCTQLWCVSVCNKCIIQVPWCAMPLTNCWSRAPGTARRRRLQPLEFWTRARARTARGVQARSRLCCANERTATRPTRQTFFCFVFCTTPSVPSPPPVGVHLKVLCLFFLSYKYADTLASNNARKMFAKNNSMSNFNLLSLLSSTSHL